jgi:uncharacterized protein YdbL (DUF1318 family)
MTAFFIIISIMLNIIALMAIVILFLRQNKLLKVEVDQKKSLVEIEELMSSYLLEMKDENERFIEQINEINEGERKLKQASLNHVVENQLEQELSIEKENSQGGFSSLLGKTVNFQAVKAYQKQKKEPIESKELGLSSNEVRIKENEKVEEDSLKSEQKDAYDPNRMLGESLFEQIINMKQQGFSEEEMAKKLNKGKTEIALLLKFRENQ